LFLQNLLNYNTALAAGLAMTPRGIGAFLATIVSVASPGTSVPRSDHRQLPAVWDMHASSLATLTFK